MATCPQCGTEYPSTVRLCTKDGTVLEDTRPAAASDSNIGKVLDGKYRLDARLSGGGMGTVYRGTHLMLNKVVAVKLINAELVTSPEIVKRFQREARAASALNHPNITPAYDLGQTDDGTLYIAMELVNGPNLKEVIRSSGQLDPARIVRILRQVASALSMAHKHEIIHRDLKPHNIVIIKDERGQDFAKLLDFGIAKTFDDSSTQLTQTGFALGTPQYMSPEQAMGQVVDGRSDIYALGVILYEMLIGEVPFNDPSAPAILVKQLTEIPAPPSRKRPDLVISPTLEAIALRCLEKDPAARFQTVDELSEALEAATGAHTSAVAPGAAPVDDLATLLLPGNTPAPGAATRTGAPVTGGSAATRTGAPGGAAPTINGLGAPNAAPLTAHPTAPGGGVPRTVTAPAAAAPVMPTRPASTPPLAPSHAPSVGSADPVPATVQKRGMSGAVVAIAAVLLLALVGTGAVYGLGYLNFSGAKPSDPGSGTPTPTASATPTPSPTSEVISGSGGSSGATTTPPPVGTPTAPPPSGTTSGASKPATPLVTPAPPSTPPATGRSGSEQQAVAAPPLPAIPSVAFRCSGNGPDVCSSLKTAMDETLEKEGMPSVRDVTKAEIIIEARVTQVDERTSNIAGASFTTRTFSMEFSGEARRSGEGFSIPSQPNLTFDARYKGKADDAARVAAIDIVEKIRAYWKKRQP